MDMTLFWGQVHSFFSLFFATAEKIRDFGIMQGGVILCIFWEFWWVCAFYLFTYFLQEDMIKNICFLLCYLLDFFFTLLFVKVLFHVGFFLLLFWWACAFYLFIYFILFLFFCKQTWKKFFCYLLYFYFVICYFSCKIFFENSCGHVLFIYFLQVDMKKYFVILLQADV